MNESIIPMKLEKMFQCGEGDLYKRNMEICFDLLESGAAVADLALDKLLLLAEAGGMIANDPKAGYPVMHLISTISLMAKPQHAQKIAKLLVSDEILSDGRARRGPLVRTLERIGSKEEANALDYYKKCIVYKKYPEFVFDNPEICQRLFPEAQDGMLPSSYLKSADLDEVEQAIAAISERT